MFPPQKKTISLSRLLLDGEVIIFSKAELILEHQYIDAGNDKKIVITKHIDWRINVDNPDIQIMLTNQLMDIEMKDIEGIIYGGSGFTSEIESHKNNIEFMQIQGNGILKGYEN